MLYYLLLQALLEILSLSVVSSLAQEVKKKARVTRNARNPFMFVEFGLIVFVAKHSWYYERITHHFHAAGRDDFQMQGECDH